MLVRIFIGVAFLLGLGGFAVAILSSAPAPTPVAAAPPPPPPVVMSVLTARRALPAGTLLANEDIGATPVAGQTRAPATFEDTVANRTKLRGSMVRRSLDVNEPLTSADLLNPGDRGFLAAVLGNGMRAVSVGVDAVTGTAGLIWPGDRVDLVLTQTLDGQEQPLDRRVVGETVLSDVRVIAVDQQLIQGGQAGGQGGNGPGPNPSSKTITLEVTPSDAERVAVASRLGRLSVTIRSASSAGQVPASGSLSADGGVSGDVGRAGPKDAAARDGGGLASDGGKPRVMWSGDVSSALRRGDKAATTTVRVFRGAKDPIEVKF